MSYIIQKLSYFCLFALGDIVVEDGAQWIHGDESNPLYPIASEMKELSEEIPENQWGNFLIWIYIYYLKKNSE